MLVQALVAQPAVEGFDEAVLRRFARRNVPREQSKSMRMRREVADVLTIAKQIPAPGLEREVLAEEPAIFSWLSSV